MIAVDTNVLVRLITGDDEKQAQAALALAERQPFYVSFTVLQEVDWVLRSSYCFNRTKIVSSLEALGALINLRYEDDADAFWALERYAIAGELADYLHIAAARTAGRFPTFETKLARRAGGDAPVPVETLS